MNPFDKYLTKEDIEHVQVVNFIKDKLPGVVYTHVPTTSRKSPFERYKYSIMGSLRGCPDFIILYPKIKTVSLNGKNYKDVEYFGLCIELKTPEYDRLVTKGKKAGKTVKTVGKASPEQLEVISRLQRLRYKACLCFGAEEAIAVLKDYFNIK